MIEEKAENQPSVRTKRSSEAKTAFKIWLDTNLKGDHVIWLIIVALATISLMVVYSATGTLAYRSLGGDTEHYLIKHSSLLVLALGAIWVAHRIDYRYYSRLSRLALLLCVPLLLLTWKFGVNINEASRWITIPFIGGSFQTSDFAKLALISSIASMLARRQDNINDFQETVLPILIWTGVICTLIGLSDVSSALLLFITCFLLMFIGRIPLIQLGMLLFVGIISIMLSLYLGQRLETVESRVNKFAYEETPFQAQQSYIAVTSGGFIGRGPGNSVQRNFLPNPYSDFIYAIIVEEYGFVGGAIVLGLYLLLLYRGVVVVASSSQPFGGILSAGLTFSLVIQAFLNMAVSVGLVPITGVPMPLVSMGGTSLFFTGIALGIILSVSRGEVDEDIEMLSTQTKGKIRVRANVKSRIQASNSR